MLENKEQEKIAGIISDFFDGTMSEADIDILAMKIYEKDVAKLEQDLEFTTKTANELIEIKHKLEQELAELKEKAIVPKFKVRQEVWWIDTRGNIYNKQNYKIDSYLIDSIVVTDNKFRYYGEDGCWLSEEDLFATEEEAQAKLKEIQGNE